MSTTNTGKKILVNYELHTYVLHKSERNIYCEQSHIWLRDVHDLKVDKHMPHVKNQVKKSLFFAFSSGLD